MDPAEQLVRARHLFARGSYDAAVGVLAELLREDAGHIEAHKLLAQVRFAQGYRQ